MLIQRGQWISSLRAALAPGLHAADACLGLSRAPLRVILRVVHLAPLMHGRAASAFCSSTLRDPLRSKRNASPTQTHATLGQMRWQPALGWHLLCHNLGSFHGSVNRKCNRAPACPCALPLSVLIESPCVWLALCTHLLGFSRFDEQFKIVFFDDNNNNLKKTQRSMCFYGAYAQTSLQVMAFRSLSQGAAVCTPKLRHGVHSID